METINHNNSCSFERLTNSKKFDPQAEDILTDEDLLELFRIIKHIIKKKPDTERIAKLYFCIAYAMGDMYQFYKPKHSDHLIFKDESNSLIADILLPTTSSCCQQEKKLSVSYLTNPSSSTNVLPPIDHSSIIRPYKSIYSSQSLTPSSSSSSFSSSSPFSLPTIEDHRSTTSTPLNRYTLLNDNPTEVLMEPKQRGFYYQENRLSREPPLLQRYAEHGVLTQDSLMTKRIKNPGESDFTFELPTPTKKPKIPHRHGEFNQRRDDIISRMRTVLMADLEQKAQRLPENFTLTIEKATLPTIDHEHLTTEEASQLLAPALRILTFHSNMKPHLDNGMNQNGIYYNNDYFRLYLAFVQFQHIFRELFPNEIITYTVPTHHDDIMPSPSSIIERDKDRERNTNMKAYRPWIEPHLTETNWAAFRRNIMVGERIMQLTQVVGQGVLLMTKELSGSKLHLTFTNNEWDEFIQGLRQGLWDETIDWSHDDDDILAEYRKNNKEGGSLLVNELRLKFATHFWFTEDGHLVPPSERKAARSKERLHLMNKPSA